MAGSSEGRRDRLTFPALDPNPAVPDGSADGECEVSISHTRLQATGRRTAGAIKEAAFLVTEALAEPTAVFEGIRLDEEDDPKSVGWRCYCTTPKASYRADGSKAEPYRGQVFLVFVNEDRVAYNWRWERAHADDPGAPERHDTRFRKRLM